MQVQTSPLISDDRPVISEYAEPQQGTIESDLVSRSQQNGGQIVIAGDSLSAIDQTLKVIHVVASNGRLLCSNLP